MEFDLERVQMRPLQTLYLDWNYQKLVVQDLLNIFLYKMELSRLFSCRLVVLIPREKGCFSVLCSKYTY